MRNGCFVICAIGILSILSIGCSGPRVAGGPISGDSLQDGIYEGEATEGPVKVQAKVTIENHQITDINLISHRTWKGRAAEKTIPERIIMQQSTSVDAVSGATLSSITIMNAVEDALQKAR